MTKVTNFFFVFSGIIFYGFFPILKQNSLVIDFHFLFGFSQICVVSNKVENSPINLIKYYEFFNIK